MSVPSTDTILQDYVDALAAGQPAPYRSGRLIEVLDGRTIRGRGADLAVYLPSGRHGRKRPLLLITGDEWAPSGPFQTSVQWTVRSALERAAPVIGADVLVVPFSALAAAGIVRESIRPLELRPAHSWTETRYADEWRHVPVRERTLYRDETRYADTLETVPPRYRHTWREDPETGRYAWGDVLPDEAGRYSWTVRVPYDRPRDEAGRYSWTVHRHRLGDALFTARVVERRRRARPWTVRDVIGAAVDVIHAETQSLADVPYNASRARHGTRVDGPVSRDEVRPAAERLAAVDITTPIVETVPITVRRRFVSSFDTNEPRPLYFLATLPGTSRARTVESALQDLAPAAVHAAYARGRDVYRQGDIFYVATDLADETVSAMAHTRARLTQLTRGAVPRPGEVGHVAPVSDSRARRMRTFRRRAIRDELKRNLAYATENAQPKTAPGLRRQLAQDRARNRETLERHKATARRAVLRGDARAAANARSHARMYAELVPLESAGRRSVRHTGPSHGLAAGRGRDAYRTGYGTNALSARDRAHERTLQRFQPLAAAASRDDRRARLLDALSVHGTSHTATEVIHTRDGRVYVRGIARHVPEVARERRARDHVDVRLGDGRQWYLAIRNTVPRLRGEPDPRAAGWTDTWRRW